MTNWALSPMPIQMRAYEVNLPTAIYWTCESCIIPEPVLAFPEPVGKNKSDRHRAVSVRVVSRAGRLGVIARRLNGGGSEGFGGICAAGGFGGSEEGMRPCGGAAVFAVRFSSWRSPSDGGWSWAVGRQVSDRAVFRLTRITRRGARGFCELEIVERRRCRLLTKSARDGARARLRRSRRSWRGRRPWGRRRLSGAAEDEGDCFVMHAEHRSADVGRAGVGRSGALCWSSPPSRRRTPVSADRGQVDPRTIAVAAQGRPGGPARSRARIFFERDVAAVEKAPDHRRRHLLTSPKLQTVADLLSVRSGSRR